MFRSNHRIGQNSVVNTVCWLTPQKDYDADYDNDDYDDADDKGDDKYAYSNTKLMLIYWEEAYIL